MAKKTVGDKGINKEDMIEVWAEKYRATEFNEIVGQDEIVKRAEAFVKARNMPHLLFAGPAGSGKTTLALIIVKKLFGKSWHENYLELNASDERGINVVREKVKNFARTRSIGNAPFKIIFLDEADALTKEAQQALRRTMENFTRTCRFILSCNYSSKIIDPIQSRCSIFRFRSLTEDNVAAVVSRIAKNESLKVNKEAIKALYELSNGDCRRVINLLQASASISKNITQSLVYKIVAMAKPSDIKDMVLLALKGKFVKARGALLKIMTKDGISGIDVIKAIQSEIWNLNMDDKTKLKITEKIGDTEFRLVEGSDEFIQIESLLAFLGLIEKS